MSLELSYGLVAVAHSVGFELTYIIPAHIAQQANFAVGAVVVVPVQGKKRVGIYLGPCAKPEFKCAPLEGIVPYTRPLPLPLVHLLSWLAQYYLAPVGRTVGLFAPGFLWDAKAIERREKRFSKFQHEGAPPQFEVKIRGEMKSETAPLKTLGAEQTVTLNKILESPKPVTLLQGITGSGKTEVYLHAATRVLAEGRNVLMLVPEIALTPQMSGRFRAVFGSSLAILHSGLTAVEHEREWFRVQTAQARVVLGVRSCVFAPLANVGLIVVDEEHDQSYKCDDFPCYHARDVAVKRAQLEGARCVLGSATPSLESFYNAQQGRYEHAELHSRFIGSLPQSTVIDARLYLPMYGKQGKGKRKTGSIRSSSVAFKGPVIAPPVLEALRQTKEKNEQSMLIINRRGYAQYCLCSTCGNALKCPHCAVTTTLHKHGQSEICHYCGFSRNTLTSCPECSQETLVAMGAGTQNIEAELQQALPQLRVARLDRDVLTSNTRLSTLLEDFRSGAIDCLVGTQILSKGHDFPRVTTVAILHVEDGLFLPDYRSAERTFQLLTQAAGRAGRGTLAGRVFVQSLAVGHPVVEAALAGNVQSFLLNELEMRTLGWHPPLCRQILFEFHSKLESEALRLGNLVRAILVEHWQKRGLLPDEVRMCGPYPATLEKLREEYRFQLCVSAQKHLRPSHLVPEELSTRRELAGKMRIDVDPYSFL